MAQQALWTLSRRIPTPLPAAYDGIDTLLAKVLYSRKYEVPADIDAFLHPEDDHADPFTLPDMRQAVDRVLAAIDAHEAIVVYGDYDADGITASAVLVSALQAMGANVAHHVPSRAGGYGLHDDALDQIKADGAHLVITVDCGIRNVREVERAVADGDLDIIITDHHTVPPELPRALAIIDPKREDSEYGYENLAGVGVAYRLVQALYSEWNSRLGPDQRRLDATRLLDLVAVGTVADIVPLTGENRSLVRQGLGILRTSPRPGLQALVDVSGTSVGDVDSEAIAFRLGPRINAASRMEPVEASASGTTCQTADEDPAAHGARLAFALLMSESLEEAAPLAQDLDALNQERRRKLEGQYNLASRQIDSVPALLTCAKAHLAMAAARLATVDEPITPDKESVVACERGISLAESVIARAEAEIATARRVEIVDTAGVTDSLGIARLAESEDASADTAGTDDLEKRAEKARARLQSARDRITQARSDVDALETRRLLFVADTGFDHGIVGLIASRLKENYYRPCLVMRIEDNEVRGSARSVEDFHITRALESCRDLLLHFGGHAKAAGFTVTPANLEALRQRLDDYAAEHLKASDLQRKITVDAIVRLGEITEETVRSLQALEPVGEGVPPAMLASVGVEIVNIRPVGRDGSHLKLTVSQNGIRIGAIAFRMGDLAAQYRAGDVIDLVYSPSLNRYNGNVSAQLVVQDIRPGQQGGNRH